MPRARAAFWAFVIAGLVLASALAFFVGPRASSEPDGLNRVAIDQGFADRERPHSLDGSPAAGYALEGVDDARLSTGLAGVAGVVVTFGLGLGLFVLVGRRRRGRVSSPSG